MYPDYADIRDRLGTPVWFDEHRVPRYCAFDPNRIAHFYASETALLSISCVICRQEYIVAISMRAHKPKLSEMINGRVLDYGDLPNANCCGNPHMSSEPRRVLQYWRRPLSGEWRRNSSFEIDIRPQWVLDEDLDRPWRSEFKPNSACEPRRRLHNQVSFPIRPREER